MRTATIVRRDIPQWKGPPRQAAQSEKPETLLPGPLPLHHWQQPLPRSGTGLGWLGLQLSLVPLTVELGLIGFVLYKLNQSFHIFDFWPFS